MNGSAAGAYRRVIASSDGGVRVLPRLHLVTDERVVRSAGFIETASQLMREFGPRIAIHLRGRKLTGRELYSAAAACNRIAEETDSLIVINDRVDVALACGCGGVQAGFRSLPLRDLRRLAPERLLLGASVHARDEAARDVEEGADFLLAGTLYTTASHPDVEPSGIGWIRALPGLGVPIIGIGGITVDRISEVVAADVYGVAVIRAVWDAPDPIGAAAVLLEALDAATG